MAFLVCLLFRESIGVAITKSFVIFVRKFFVSIYLVASVLLTMIDKQGIHRLRKFSGLLSFTPAVIGHPVH